MADMRLQVVLALRDQLSAGLQQVQNRMRGVAQAGQAMQIAGAKMLAAGAAGLAAMKGPVAAFAEAEDAATQLKVAMMGAGGQVAAEFDQINALALRLGNTLPGTTADFQQMMTMLVRQGVTAQTILSGTGEAAAQLGVMLKLPAAGAAEFAAKLQDATKTSAKDMTALADTIQKTFYLGVDPGNMLAAFSALAPAMSAIKQEGLAGAQAMAPLVAMLDQAGLAGGSAGNALRKVFQEGFDAKKIQAANADLKQFGISLQFLGQGGEFAGLDNLFAQLDKLKDLNTSDRLAALKKVWGDDSETLQALSTMIDKGRAGYEEVAAKLAGQASLQQRVNEQLGTLKNLWDAASGSFTNTVAAWAGAIAPELKALATWFGEASVAVSGFIAAHPGIAKWTAGIVAFGSAALVLGGALSLAAGSVMTLLAPLAALVSPIGLVVAAGAALVALNWGTISAWIPGAVAQARALWSSLQAGAQAVAPVLAGLGRGLMSGLQQAGRFAQGFMQGFVAELRQNQAAAAALDAVMKGLGNALAWVGDKLAPLGNWLAQLIGPTTAAGDAAQTLGQRWGKAAAELLATIASLPGKIKGFVGDMLAAGAALIEGLIQGIMSKLEAAKAAIVGVGTSIKGWFSSALGIQSPSKVFAAFGGFLTQGLARGIQAGAGQVLGAMQRLTGAVRAGIGEGQARLGDLVPPGLGAAAGRAVQGLAPPAAVKRARTPTAARRARVADAVRRARPPAALQGAIPPQEASLRSPAWRGPAMPPRPQRLAGPAKGAAGAGGGSSVVNFSPTIHVAGGKPEETKAAVTQALKLSQREFERVAASSQHAAARRGYV